MERLREFADGETRCSDLWRTSPVDCPPGSAEFVNAAMSFHASPGLTPESLLAALKAIEAEYGRGAARVRNAPRELDLDLLLFDAEMRDSADFVLPHPRAADRLFVLAPAAQVAAEAVWPGIGRTIRELRDEVASDERVERIEAHAAL